MHAIYFSAHVYLLFVTLAAGLSVGENIPGICCKLNLVAETQSLASQCPDDGRFHLVLGNLFSREMTNPLCALCVFVCVRLSK